MATTLSDMIQKVRRRLVPGGIEETVVLASNYTAGGATLTVSDPSGVLLPTLRPGLKLGIDLEVFLIQAVTGTTVTVVPGFNGSAQANHTANAVIYVNPIFSQWDIMTAINDDLLDLSSAENGLFQVKSLEITYNPATMGYDMTDINGGGSVTNVDDIISVRYKVPYPVGQWVPIERGRWEVTPQSDTSAFTSGFAFTLYGGAYPGLPIRITYAAPFGQFAALGDDATTVAGLTSTMYDLPPLGAQIALVAGREVARNRIDAEPDSRRGNEVPPGAVMNSTAGLLRLRTNRVAAEAVRLQQAYGMQRET